MADSTRLGPGVGEQGPLDAGVGALHERLGQEPGKQRAVHLDEVGEVRVEGLVDRPGDSGVAPAQGEHAEPGQEIEVAPTLGVVEVTALAPRVVVVEPDGLEHAAHLRVHVLRLQAEVLTLACPENFLQLERHQRLLVARRGSEYRLTTQR